MLVIWDTNMHKEEQWEINTFFNSTSEKVNESEWVRDTLCKLTLVKIQSIWKGKAHGEDQTWGVFILQSSSYGVSWECNN